MLDKTYQPQKIEGVIYDAWEAASAFAAGASGRPGAKPYAIVIPPPNVTGSLHMGHALNNTLQDILVRFERMRGRDVLWQPGTDHAGIATQMVVERQLMERQEPNRHAMGREAFIRRVWQWKEESGNTIVGQLKRLGASCDWSRLRFTMDEGLSRAVRKVFVELHRAGLIYKDKRLVNWDPELLTAISDLEVEQIETKGHLWHLRYPIEGREGEFIVVATTRPETMLGDTAVAVHPDDERYKHLVGKNVILPLVGRRIPIVADEYSDPEKGSGAVKITPAHDYDDHATGLRHDLPAPTILADDASIAGTGTRYDGMDRYEARTAILADLEAHGDLVAATPHEMVVGRCQRSNDVIEPRLKTQWFIRTGPLAERALEATRSGRTRILPERFEKTWEHWLTDIRDWNVSRQLWWGHRIPAWYCPDGHVTVTSVEAGPDACSVCGRPAAELRQDPDIFDTWFSSGLWPFSTLGWPDDTDDYRTYYPTSVMETGYDIIFFWVARMMMLGLELTGTEPFHTVYLSGLIRDPLGQKMSKTKGNVVDPLGVIDASGADALRFALIHGATPGNDQRFGPAKLEHARNFANKLWNATRYVAGARPTSIPEGAERRVPDARHLGPGDRWLLSRAAATTAAVDAAMAGFGFGEVTRLLYEAIWNEYCDWGLELAKVRLVDPNLDVASREATWWTLTEVLDTYLRLLHPVMPFVTEALWDALPHRASDPALLIVARWPGAAERDTAAERQVDALIELVTGIRNARASAKLPAADWLETLVFVPLALGPTFEALRPAVERMARARPLHRELTPEALEAATRPGDLAVIVIAGEIEAAVRPVAAHAGADALERDRLARDLAEAEGRLTAARERLANDSFVSRAPAAVVDGARAREAELSDQVARLRDRLER